jgi:protein transport protein SEC20
MGIKKPYCLAESSKTLSSTYSEYQNFGSLVHISKRVITQLETSDWFDRLLLLFGLLLFTLVVLYIIKKRTWDVGISWVSWLTQTKKSKQLASSIVTNVATSVVTVKATPIEIPDTATLIHQSPTSTTLIETAASSIIELIIESASPALRDEL